MSLADELRSLRDGHASRPGPTCTVAVILAQLPEEDAAQLEAAIDNPSVSGSSIAGTLTRNGHAVSDKTVLRHRRRGSATGCRCPRNTR